MEADQIDDLLRELSTTIKIPSKHTNSIITQQHETNDALNAKNQQNLPADADDIDSLLDSCLEENNGNDLSSQAKV
ncbi:hypothetical protein HK100_012005 [Physocladia obscura]|uniref:Uncharacterized protein n=1 Tax=Physocladia obscura TaxID=109957 RepID=A0AAD5T8N2_9FUNG|nr:hypothetical protein HK100_012005 [Physocladia obscura]